MPVLLNRVVPPAPGKGICPHLGMAEDPQTCLAYPSEWNLCQRARPAAAVRLEHQRAACLLPVHTACPVYQSEQAKSLPAHLRKPRSMPGSRKMALLVVVVALIGFGLWAAWRSNPGMALLVQDNLPSFNSTQPASPRASNLATFAIPPSPAAPQVSAQKTFPPPVPSPIRDATSVPLKNCGYALEDRIELEGRVLTLHQVAYGESMDMLALNYETSIQAIQALNYFLPSPLWANVVIVIPIGSTDVSDLPIFEPALVAEPVVSQDTLAQQLSATAVDLVYNNLDAECPAYTGWVLVTRPARKNP